jgi:hypothetical protein
MKQILLLLTILFSGNYCLAQADSLLLKDSLIQKDSVAPEKSTLTLGVSYANNANYYGQKAAERMAYVATAASYRHRTGFYLNGVAYRLLDDNSHVVSAYSAGVGVDFKLSKRLSADLSYTHTFYPELSPFLQASNPHMASISISHQGWLTTSVGGDYAFGKTNDFFTTIGVSKQINLFSVSRKDVVTLTPVLDVTGGTQRFYKYYVTEKNLRDSLLDILPPILGTPPRSGSTTSIEAVTSFDLLSYNLKLPLAYNRSSYMIEVACQLSLLGQKAQSDPGKLNSFFTGSFYYQF